MRLRDTPFPEQSFKHRYSIFNQSLGEEIRLALIHLLMKIFNKGYIQPLNQNLGEIMYTLSKVLGDTFADIKKVNHFEYFE